MAGMPVTIQGRVARLLTNAAAVLDGNLDHPLRQASRYGDLGALAYLTPHQAAAVEGSYFTWTQEGTRNTGVTLTAAAGTTYSATQAILVVANTNPPGGPDVILDFLEIKYDAVNTAGTVGYFYHVVDDGNRYSSGGAAMTGYNADGAQPPGVLAYTGAITATAATAMARDVGHTVYLNGVGAATTISVRIKFGAWETSVASIAIPATTAQAVTMYGPPVVVRPGKSFLINEFQTARTAAGTGEFFLGAIVR